METTEWKKVKYNNGNMTWSTAKEMDFIDTMGGYRHQLRPMTEEQRKKRYLKLLIGYQKGIERRKNWGDIDPVAIKRYVKERIARECAQP